MYNPGINYRGGDLIAAGMGDLGRSIGGLFAQRGQQVAEADMIRTALGGARQPALLPGQEAAAAPTTPFGMADNAGAMEGPNEGTGEGGATEEMKAQAKVAKAMREMGQHGYGLPRERLDTMSLAELRGLMRQEERKVMGQEMALKQLAAQQAQQRIEQEAAIEQRIREGQRFNQGMAAKNFDLDWRKQMTAEGDAVMDRVRQSGLDLLREQDTRSQVSLRAAQEQEILNNLKGGADHAPREVKFGDTRVIYSPKGGQFQLAPTFTLPEGLPEVAGRTAIPTGRGGVSYIPTGDVTDKDRYSRLTKQEGKLLDGISKSLFEEEKTALRRQLRSVQEEIRGLESGRSESTPSAPGQPATPASPPTITTQAQFDALPSGATYKGKDGRTYRKP